MRHSASMNWRIVCVISKPILMIDVTDTVFINYQQTSIELGEVFRLYTSLPERILNKLCAITSMRSPWPCDKRLSRRGLPKQTINRGFVFISQSTGNRDIRYRVCKMRTLQSHTNLRALNLPPHLDDSLLILAPCPGGRSEWSFNQIIIFKLILVIDGCDIAYDGHQMSLDVTDEVNISSGIGLVPSGKQAITGTNVDHVLYIATWRHLAKTSWWLIHVYTKLYGPGTFLEFWSICLLLMAWYPFDKMSTVTLSLSYTSRFACTPTRVCVYIVLDLGTLFPNTNDQQQSIWSKTMHKDHLLSNCALFNTQSIARFRNISAAILNDVIMSKNGNSESPIAKVIS